MPAILPPGKEREWLRADETAAKALLTPFPAEKMNMFEVSRKVNSAANDTPDLLEPKSGKGTLTEWMK